MDLDFIKKLIEKASKGSLDDMQRIFDLAIENEIKDQEFSMNLFKECAIAYRIECARNKAKFENLSKSNDLLEHRNSIINEWLCNYDHVFLSLPYPDPKDLIKSQLTERVTSKFFFIRNNLVAKLLYLELIKIGVEFNSPGKSFTRVLIQILESSFGKINSYRHFLNIPVIKLYIDIIANNLLEHAYGPDYFEILVAAKR